MRLRYFVPWSKLTYQITIPSNCQAQVADTFFDAMLKYSFPTLGTVWGAMRSQLEGSVICATKLRPRLRAFLLLYSHSVYNSHPVWHNKWQISDMMFR